MANRIPRCPFCGAKPLLYGRAQDGDDDALIIVSSLDEAEWIRCSNGSTGRCCVMAFHYTAVEDWMERQTEWHLQGVIRRMACALRLAKWQRDAAIQETEALERRVARLETLEVSNG